MRNSSIIESIDYLLIGHVTKDITPSGYNLGGTASYSALTAKALGLKVGVVTICEANLEFPELEGISMVVHAAEHTTTFQNIQTPLGRKQYVNHVAPMLNISHVPESWRNTPIVHLGPIAQEIDPNLVRYFPNSLICITPQGMLHGWNENGLVHFREWPESNFVLEKSNVVIISVEDVQGDEDRIEEMASAVKILVVTEGSNGARLYWNGDLRRFHAPAVPELDPTGAGDIFASAFFFRYYRTRDPWEATRYATCLASKSVSRVGLKGVPSPEETTFCLTEILSS